MPKLHMFKEEKGHLLRSGHKKNRGVKQGLKQNLQLFGSKKRTADLKCFVKVVVPFVATIRWKFSEPRKLAVSFIN
jgi:hypothetical protein